MRLLKLILGIIFMLNFYKGILDIASMADMNINIYSISGDFFVNANAAFSAIFLIVAVVVIALYICDLPSPIAHRRRKKQIEPDISESKAQISPDVSSKGTGSHSPYERASALS